MRNLYEILGVQPTATLADIRAAYRQLCRKHHPDAGGTREGFEEISVAHDVLTDTDARAFYDQTGQIKGRKPEGVDNAEMLNLIAQAFEHVIQTCDDPERVDVIRMVNDYLLNMRVRAEMETKATKEMVKRLEKTRDRMKVKKGENFFASMIANKIAPLTARIEMMQGAQETMTRALAFLKDYEFDVKKGGGRVGQTTFSGLDMGLNLYRDDQT